MLTLNDGRNELWQWDTGRTLSVDADCSQVHFSNKVFGRSIDVDVSDGTAIIPDILLQTDKDLNVWAFVGTAENGYTKISKTFKVNRRNKPADYVFTPPEQTTLSELVERLDAIEESQDPDAIKNVVKDYLKQNPVEVPVKSVNGKTGAVELKASDVGAISKEDLQNATNEALAQAKESGEFDGAAGPQGPQGDPGPAGADGPPGDDYVLTDADRQEIAEIAAGLVEVPDSAETTRADELIASGITPTGAKGFVETGMTWRQLKEYREFVLMIASVGDNTNFPSSCSFRIRTATNFDYWGMPPLGRLDKSGAVVRVRFIDDEKTIYGISAVYDTAYQVKTSVAYSEESMLNYRSAGFFGPIHGGMGYVDLTANSAGAPDDSPVVLYFPAATTCEYEWKAIGVFR